MNFRIVFKILNIGQKSEIWSKFLNLVEFLRFGRNFESRLKFGNLVKIRKFGKNFEILENSEIWPKL